MTAAVAVHGGGFRAPAGARIRAVVGFAYIGVLGGVTLARSASVANILRVGEAAAARAVVLSAVVIVFALLVLAVRQAAVGVDEDGVTWGWGGLAFRARRARIRLCRVYRDAVAVVMTRGSTWYLSARDYGPFDRLVAAVRSSRLPCEEVGGNAPLAARLQAYGVALEIILFLDALMATYVFVAA
jgi:hypothetical protein